MSVFEMATGSNQAGRSSLVFIPGTDLCGTTAGIRGNSLFENILNTKSKNYHASAISQRPHGSGRAVPGLEKDKNSSATGFVSFREARAYAANTSSHMAGRKRGVETDTYDEEFSNDVKNAKNCSRQYAAGSVLQITAQLLGIGTDELQRILCMADTEWHANGINSTDEMVLYLSQALGLTGEQQDRLAELLATAVESQGLSNDGNIAEQAGIGEENSCIVVEGEYKATQVSVKSTRNSIPDGTDNESFIEKLSECIRLKLDELGVRQVMDKGEAEQQMEVLMTLPAENRDVNEEPAMQQDGDESGITPASARAVKEASKKADMEDDVSMQVPYGDMSGDESEGLEIPDGEGLQTDVHFMPANPPGENIAAITGKDTGAIIQPRDIINQVIEKVKVILTPEKSEIAMELKPESLGRVSLKVSAENGLVMARFVAENQQVKQVLEANMQLLKDSLERQGINVQGFSVSVRQESDGYPDNGYGPGESGRMVSAGKAYLGSHVEGDMHELTGVFAASGAYLWDYSTINLTA